MHHLFPQPRRRRSVPERVQRLVSTAWLITALALPALAVAFAAGIGPAPAPANPTQHTVRAGETLAVIARQYGVGIEALVSANGLANPDVIYAGQVLTIPLADASGTEFYTVQRGDTLAIIAARAGVTVGELAALNGLPDPNSIIAGQQLRLPGAEPPAAQPAAADPPAAEAAAPTGDAQYVLRRGDSLYRVSLVYGVPVEALLAANNLPHPNAITPGLALRIPAPQPLPAVPGAAEVAAAAGAVAGAVASPATHTVAPGDTLARIAIRYDTTVDGIVAENGLSSPDRIYPGQALRIPPPGAAARPAPARTATQHVVATGETLAEIALRYGVTAHALGIANEIENPASVVAGMTLSIPSAQAGTASVRYAADGPGLCGPPDSLRAGTGYFIRPTRGYVVTQQFHAWHPGIDLALDTGNDVYAADSGTVIYAGWNPVGYGNLVVLDHGNGWRTYYAHLSAYRVECGEWVARSSILGAIGSTGNSTGPHLHFEMLRFGVAVDSSAYIRW